MKSKLTKHKKDVLEDKVTYLKDFNQSESKHWQVLLSINMENNSNKKFINLKNDYNSTSDPGVIGGLFACTVEPPYNEILFFTNNNPGTDFL